MARARNKLRDFAQGLSNGVASYIGGPMDIAESGVNLGIAGYGALGGMTGVLRPDELPQLLHATPGTTAWMERQGLTARPQNALAGALGEGLGMAAPAALSAKAPVIANALLRSQDNAMIPRRMNQQAGAIDTKALQEANPSVDFWLMQRGDGGQAMLGKVALPKAERGKGAGSKFMQDLTAAADADGATLTLSPSTDFGATSKARLVEFYRRFGFVPNKGKHKDFTISDSMYRPPKK